MAEVKNSFIASKMNKDLDDRLVPSNQYRNAFNVAVSESESGDVGALENVQGNSLITSYTNGINAICIGRTIDEANNNIYLFFTDYTDTSPSRLVNPATAGSNCAVVKFNTLSNTFTTLVEGLFLNFSTTHPIYGVNLVENLLFWTDNRNQPRQLNVNGIDGGYTNEDHISVAKYAPWKPIQLVKEIAPAVFEGTMVTASTPGGIGSTVAVFLNDYVNVSTGISVQVLSGDPNETDPIKGVGIPLGTTILNPDETVSGVVTFDTTNPISVDAGSTLVQGDLNPDYIPNYAGDPNFLRDKFARFSYRFKFYNNEYSIIAPFTQTAFIPGQDGYFLKGDEERTYLSAEVSFMENRVDLIDLVIPFPEGMTAGSIRNDLKLKEIDILYKESDSLAIRVVDTISIDQIELETSTDEFYEYMYQSTKPVLTLPSSETTRAYDKTPVRAFSQEVSGNRVIYGNFINKHTAPNSLNYEVTANQKLTAGPAAAGVEKEYPYHTLKRNRNYQVGIVLADRYGRQSDVILSNAVINNTSNNVFGASTFYFPYRDLATITNVANDIGNSIKILFQDTITSLLEPLTPLLPNQSGAPGLYSPTNPTGWYTYKVVVKQVEQDYYNTYVPSIFNGDVIENAASINLAYTTLISDNINKVPKDLQDVSADQAQFNSDIKLFCVVNTPNQDLAEGQTSYNIQGYPLNTQNVVTTISTLSGYGVDIAATTPTHESVLQAASDPYVAKLQTPFAIGKLMENSKLDLALGVFETNPFVSNLDIYYETSTTGLISELNTKIINDEGNLPSNFSALNYEHYENQDPEGAGLDTGDEDSPYVTNNFVPFSGAGIPIVTSDVTRFEARSNSNTTLRAQQINGAAVGSVQDFELVRTGTSNQNYRIKILEPFYFGPNAIPLESYTFTFDIRDTSDDTAGDVVNAPVTSSATIGLENLTPGKEIYVGMKVYDVFPNLLGKVQSITTQDVGVSATIVLSNSVVLTDGTNLDFYGTEITLIEFGQLKNSAPIITTPVPENDPQYASMPSPYFDLEAVNGSFDVTRNQLDLTWAFTNPTSTDATSTYLTVPNAGFQDAVFQLNKTTGVLGLSTGELSKDYSLSVTCSDISLVNTINVTVLGELGSFTDGFSTAFDI